MKIKNKLIEDLNVSMIFIYEVMIQMLQTQKQQKQISN